MKITTHQKNKRNFRLNAMRYSVQFENHTTEIVLIQFLLITTCNTRFYAFTQFQWRGFQTERQNITFKALKILIFKKLVKIWRNSTQYLNPYKIS